MSDTQEFNAPDEPVAPFLVGDPTGAFTDRWISQLDTLLDELRDLTQSAPVQPIVDREVDNQLVQVRLGIASSLFTALRYKHPPTAAHALRVALGVSAWCMRMGLPDDQRDKIEVAAMFHDLGVIGVPDRILQKPGMLGLDEAAIIDRSRHMNVEILRACCAEPDILAIVDNIPARYDGERAGYRVSGRSIPLGARIITIVESYDSMTNEQVFRPAMSQESAITELFACAGGQFDPELVRSFTEFCRNDLAALRKETGRRWLRTLDPRAVERYWRLHHAPVPAGQVDRKRVFETRLLDNMHDAAIFVDSYLTIQLWNPGAERMTGILSKTVCQQQWQPELLNLRDEKGQRVAAGDCPVEGTIRSGAQSLRRLVIWGRSGRPVPVDAHVIPVASEAGKMLGAILLLHDASSEISLERRCQTLHSEATTDPLTRVANRAEFDRAHEMFVDAHQQRRLPCSLVICDLDHFKRVNDSFGHQAGDEVIRSLAGVLKNSCRSGDLVARYGGEEFVVLCTDCDNAAAARRAEEMRYLLSRVAQPAMDGQSVTASFGVTEIQPGDTPETMLRRADRALLMAKARGRNMVVQLGMGSAAKRKTPLEGEPLPLARAAEGGNWVEHDLLAAAPMTVAIEKLRGFVADHRARILDAQDNRVRLQVEHKRTGPNRRRNDRDVAFLMEVELTEEEVAAKPGSTDAEGKISGRRLPRTRVRVAISPRTKRDRRAEDVLQRAQEMLLSLRSYLMATQQVADDGDRNVVRDGLLARSLGDGPSGLPKPTRAAAASRWLKRLWPWGA
jgi:diguanylate cyclase (GGDEF)-like protein/PAS domain S-box-containing protein